MGRFSNRDIQFLICSFVVIAIFLPASSSANAATVGPYAYIANYGQGTISVIDTQTNTVTATITVGGNPYGIAVTPDGSKVYVGKRYDSVAVIDTATNTVTATIPINAPWGIAVSPDGSRVYIADEHEGIFVIDPLTDNVIATIPLDCSPMGIAVSSNGATVYATSAVSDMIMLIDATTNTEITSSPYVGQGPWGIVVIPEYDIIYTANNWDNTVSEIDTEYLFEHSVVPVGKWPTGIAMTPDGNRLYVANSGDRTVTYIHTSYVEDRATIQVGLNPMGISVTPDGSKVYVANSGSDTVSVIDVATNTETAIIRVEDTPISFGQFIGPALEVPTADFDANRTKGVAPMGVQFTDESASVTGWQWDFGDGTTSTEQSPIHVYADAGTYTVTLTAANRNGTDTVEKTDMITAIAPTMPVAGFVANRTKGLAPLGVQFTDESTGYAAGREWNFGDGTLNSTELDPIHIYAIAGTYNVTLTAVNGNGTSMIKEVGLITVIAPTIPVAGFTANRTAGTAPLGIQFTDGSTGYVTAWAWNFGDGATSTEQSPVHIYTSDGTYSVTLTTINGNGTDIKQKIGYISVSLKSYPTPVTIHNLYNPFASTPTLTITATPPASPTAAATSTATAVPSGTPIPTATATTGNSSSSLSIWIAVLIVAVLAIGAATYLFVWKK